MSADDGVLSPPVKRPLPIESPQQGSTPKKQKTKQEREEEKEEKRLAKEQRQREKELVQKAKDEEKQREKESMQKAKEEKQREKDLKQKAKDDEKRRKQEEIDKKERVWPTALERSILTYRHNHVSAASSHQSQYPRQPLRPPLPSSHPVGLPFASKQG
jgi:hypothetical protein